MLRCILALRLPAVPATRACAFVRYQTGITIPPGDDLFARSTRSPVACGPRARLRTCPRAKALRNPHEAPPPVL